MAELASVAQIGGTAQYRPITNTLGDQVALTQNQRNYAESKAKNDEQKKLAEDLANINALGLPKNIQADVQAKRDELIERVRNGEIDPYNYDFLAEARGVAGYGAKVQNDYKNAIAAAASEGQIIEQDENGNWVNRKQDYRNTILNPDLTVDDLYSAAPKFGNMTAAVKLDDKAMLDFVTNYNKLGADEKVKLLGSNYGMLTKETISKLSPTEFENLSNAIENMGGLGFASTYADLNSRGLAEGKGFNDWKKQYITNLLPESQTKQDSIVDTQAAAREKAQRDIELAKIKEESKKNSLDFGATSGAQTSVYNPNTNQVDTYPVLGVGGNKKIGENVVQGTTIYNGEKVAVGEDGKIIPNSMDKAILYENAVKSSLDNNEKAAYEKAIENQSTLKPTSLEVDATKVSSFETALENKYGSDFNDDEEGFINFISEETGFDLNAKNNATYKGALRKFLKDNVNDFKSETGRAAIMSKLKEDFPAFFAKANTENKTETPTTTQTTANNSITFDENGNIIIQ
jgi:hypothetical protein